MIMVNYIRPISSMVLPKDILEFSTLLTNAWDESQHPRDDKGRFGEGEGGSSKEDKAASEHKEIVSRVSESLPADADSKPISVAKIVDESMLTKSEVVDGLTHLMKHGRLESVVDERGTVGYWLKPPANSFDTKIEHAGQTMTATEFEKRMHGSTETRPADSRFHDKLRMKVESDIATLVGADDRRMYRSKSGMTLIPGPEVHLTVSPHPKGISVGGHESHGVVITHDMDPEKAEFLLRKVAGYPNSPDLKKKYKGK